MWRLIDYEKDYVNDGYEVSGVEFFLIENLTSGEKKWVDYDSFRKFNELGLMAKTIYTEYDWISGEDGED